VPVHATGAALAPYLKKLARGVPILTYVTDLRGGCLAAWGNRACDVIYCPSRRTAEFLQEQAGHALENLHVGSWIAGASFVPSTQPAAVAALRARHGLRADYPTILVNTNGDRRRLAFVTALLEQRLPLNLVVLCSANPQLETELKALAQPSDMPRLRPVLWTDRLHELLALSDRVFTKPGSSLIAEAVLTRTGLFLDASQSIMPQEQELFDHVQAQSWGVAVRNVPEWLVAVRAFIEQAPSQRAIDASLKGEVPRNGLQEFCQLLLDRLAPVGPQRSARPATAVGS
jgi:UDP-N-acetylglucosamine:LPS N-acetylglucosamine transferase